MSDHHHHDDIDPRIVASASEGCEESRLLISRRSLMGLSAGFFASTLIPRSARSAATDRRLLIVILRGGMDGLQMVFPFGDSTFLERRKLLYDPIAKTQIELGSGYAAHPKLKNFASWFNDKDRPQAAIVHSIAPPLRNRSHFQCQYNLESGYGEENTPSSTGWLNRMLQNMEAGDRTSMFGAVPAGGSLTNGIVGIGQTPTILTGPAEVRSWSIAARSAGFPDSAKDLLLEHYRTNDQMLYKVLNDAIAVDELAGITKLPKEVNTSLRAQFYGAGVLMSRDDGPRIGVISIDNWDKHQNALSIEYNLGLLDDGLGDFKTGVGPAWDNTLVICVSEFGRTLEVNGPVTMGTEHGRGTIALLAGGKLVGGFHGTPPDLATEWSRPQLDPLMYGRHDLEPTLDTRQLFKAALYDYLHLDEKKYGPIVFPKSGKAPKMTGLFKA